MAFHIETSTRAAAIGAGPPARKFVDYTHKLRFENAAGETAEALATFGDGPELAEVALWADRAHGLDLLAVEEFDASGELRRRKAEAKALAERMGDGISEGEKIVQAARQEAERIVAAAKAKADDMTAEAARDLAAEKAKAEEEAAEIRATAKADAESTIAAAKATAAQVKASGARRPPRGR